MRTGRSSSRGRPLPPGGLTATIERCINSRDFARKTFVGTRHRRRSQMYAVFAYVRFSAIARRFRKWFGRRAKVMTGWSVHGRATRKTPKNRTCHYYFRSCLGRPGIVSRDHAKFSFGKTGVGSSPTRFSERHTLSQRVARMVRLTRRPYSGNMFAWVFHEASVEFL